MIGDTVSQHLPRSERRRPQAMPQDLTSQTVSSIPLSRATPAPVPPSTLILSLFEIKISALVPQLAVAVSPSCLFTPVIARVIFDPPSWLCRSSQSERSSSLVTMITLELDPYPGLCNHDQRCGLRRIQLYVLAKIETYLPVDSVTRRKKMGHNQISYLSNSLMASGDSLRSLSQN